MFQKCKTLWSLTEVLMRVKNDLLHIQICSLCHLASASLCVSLSTRADTSWQIVGFPYMVVWPIFRSDTYTCIDTQERKCPFKLYSHVNSRTHASTFYSCATFNTFFSACFNIPSINIWWKLLRSKWCLMNSYWQNWDFWISPGVDSELLSFW